MATTYAPSGAFPLAYDAIQIGEFVFGPAADGPRFRKIDPGDHVPTFEPVALLEWLCPNIGRARAERIAPLCLGVQIGPALIEAVRRHWARFRSCDCPMYRRCACDPPSIILDPEGHGAGMAAMVIDAPPEALEDARRWVDFLAGNPVDAPPPAPDPLVLHDPGIW